MVFAAHRCLISLFFNTAWAIGVRRFPVSSDSRLCGILKKHRSTVGTTQRKSTSAVRPGIAKWYQPHHQTVDRHTWWQTYIEHAAVNWSPKCTFTSTGARSYQQDHLGRCHSQFHQLVFIGLGTQNGAWPAEAQSS